MQRLIHSRPLQGSLAAPPSKSAAHRLLICAALGDRESFVGPLILSKDMEATLRCLRALGAEITPEGEGVRVVPVDTPAARPLLDCGESGSTLRFLLPVAAALGAEATFTGGGRLPDRPVKDLLEVLADHGVSASSHRLPLTLSGTLTGGEFRIGGGVSSQYITGLLLALPLTAPGRVILTSPLQSAGYVEMTRRAMALCGVETEDMQVTAPGRYRPPAALRVEGDWSNAAFFLAAGALGGPVKVSGLDPASPQGDRRILSLLERFGASVTVAPGAVTVAKGKLKGIEADMGDIPDLLPPLAILGAAAEGVTRLYNAGRCRLKECDRLSAVAALLADLGGRVEEGPEELVIHGGAPLAGGTVRGCNDHRIVMAAALAASLCREPVRVTDAEAVAKSYPGFFEDLAALGGISYELPFR